MTMPSGPTISMPGAMLMAEETSLFMDPSNWSKLSVGDDAILLNTASKTKFSSTSLGTSYPHAYASVRLREGGEISNFFSHPANFLYGSI